MHMGICVHTHICTHVRIGPYMCIKFAGLHECRGLKDSSKLNAFHRFRMNSRFNRCKDAITAVSGEAVSWDAAAAADDNNDDDLYPRV